MRSLHSGGRDRYETNNCPQTVFNLETTVGAGEERLSTTGQWDLGCRSKEGVFDELSLNTRHEGGTGVSQIQSGEESSVGEGTACAKALCREESWQRA